MRYMLVNGQGNFGSMDGDPPAAMRYTEAKMARLADETLADIDKETVDFRDNYDGTTQEPSVLPAKLRTCSLTASWVSPSVWPPIFRRITSESWSTPR